MVYHMASPASNFTPAVQHSYFPHAIRNRSLCVLIQLAELVAHILYIIQKFRKIQSQLQISTIADPVNRFSQNGTSCGNPVLLCLLHRVSAVTKSIGEKVR